MVALSSDLYSVWPMIGYDIRTICTHVLRKFTYDWISKEVSIFSRRVTSKLRLHLGGRN